MEWSGQVKKENGGLDSIVIHYLASVTICVARERVLLDIIPR
jgi:hypothetical protein